MTRKKEREANIYKVTLDNQGATTPGTEEYYYRYNTKDGNKIYYTTNELTTSFYDENKGGNYFTVPTKTGYTFRGYYNQQNGQGTQYVLSDGHATGSMYTTVADNTTLYAYWTINSYTVTYDYGTNGGQVSSSNTATTTTENKNYDANIDLTKSAYKANWAFLGWAETANATTALSKTASLKMPAGNKTLYAIYANMNVSPASLEIDLSNPTTPEITASGTKFGTATFTNKNTDLITVTTNGNKATITGKETGTAKVTVKSSAKDINGNAISKDVTVNVVRTPISVSVNKAASTIGVKSGYNTETFTATINPSGTTKDNTLTWSSSDTSIATVDQNGTVTGVKGGTAVITVTTANGKSATINITVDDSARQKQIQMPT